MKIAQGASMILGGLFLFLTVLPAHSQKPDWGKLTADAKAASQRGNYPEAARLYKQALETQETTLGPDRPEVATSLNNLAVVYQNESMDAEAEPLYRRSLAIWQKYPRASTHVATSLVNLATLYHH